MKVRLMGTSGECVALVELLREHEHIDVREVSGDYRNRGDSCLVRVYLDLETNDRKELTR